MVGGLSASHVTRHRLRENLLATIGWTESDYVAHATSAPASATSHSRYILMAFGLPQDVMSSRTHWALCAETTLVTLPARRTQSRASIGFVAIP